MKNTTINDKMFALGAKSSVIREIFEYGNKRRAEIGAENVFDFSLGNPSVPAPEIVNETMKKLLDTKESVKLHGYTSAPGDLSVRRAIADYINENFGAGASLTDIYMTVGAAASLTVSLNALLIPGEEVVAIAPFFPEYRVFVEKAGGVLRVVKSRWEDFQLDFDALDKAINEKTKAIIINSPNNPSGAVLTEETIKSLSELLERKQKEYDSSIYIISDEPYRELVYGDIKVPYIPNYYANTLVCYSFSKSLSIPGERIGYIFVSPKADCAKEVYLAVCGAGRALGFVCAPALFQYIIPDCLGKTSDVSIYKRNRDILYDTLIGYGFEAVHPDGAFYLFLKSPETDANAFCERAKKYELLLVPSDSFGVEGYVRISYCVTTEQIERSLPAFKALAEEYKLLENNMENKLLQARKIINEVDREMAKLFARRMEAAKLVAEHKKEYGLPVLDAAREDEVIRQNSAYLDGESDDVRSAYVTFLRETMELSRHYQHRLMEGMRVAYSGTEGAFACIAAGKIFPTAEKVGFGNFQDAYASVVSGECDVAVLPIENSSAGEVGQVSDLLFSGPLYVNETFDLAVKHDLLVVPGAKLEDVKTVVSHPQALGQCASYIRRHGLSEKEYVNTALAAEYVAKKGDVSIAAIASDEAASIYGLTVAAEGINETANNTTRFAVLSPVRNRASSKRGSDMRFMLMFTVRNEAGSLAKAIDIIGCYGFNMNSLRSRPMKELLWEYYFCVEAEGDIDSPDGVDMMRALSACCDKLKIIGSYSKK